MRATALIATNTFREAMRNRLLTTVLVFGGAIVASSAALAPLTLGEGARVVRDLGLAAIDVFAILLVVMVGTQLVYREIEHRTIHTILTLPVRRDQFIVGKFLGLCAAVLLSIAVLSGVYILIVALYGGGVKPSLFLALSLSFFEASIITSVALFFSCVASPLLSAVFTFFVYVSGHLSSDLRFLAHQDGSPAVELVANAAYFVLPSLHHFDIRNNILSSTPVSSDQLLYCVVYSALFNTALVLVTIAVFSRRDFE